MSTSPGYPSTSPSYPSTDQRHGAGRAASTTNAWIWALVTCGYLLPWAIAASRGKRNSGGIFWLNLLAGWTVIGWIIALAMAAGSHQHVTQPVVVVAGGPAPAPAPSSACATCRTPITWAGPAWVHQHSNSPWCDTSMTTTAQPLGQELPRTS